MYILLQRGALTRPSVLLPGARDARAAAERENLGVIGPPTSWVMDACHSLPYILYMTYTHTLNLYFLPDSGRRASLFPSATPMMLVPIVLPSKQTYKLQYTTLCVAHSEIRGGGRECLFLVD